MVLRTAAGVALRTAASTASTWRAFCDAASCDCAARVVTPMSICTRSGLAVTLASSLAAQTTARFPPDSLVNVQVIPMSTPVMQVIGVMRNFTSFLGVRCPFCHVGEEGRPLAEFDFASDKIKPESEPVLDEIADALSHNPAWKLRVEGHTDNIGGDDYNLVLSQRRADRSAFGGSKRNRP